MAKIGILGYGVVGSGIYEVLRTNGDIARSRTGEEVAVKRVLDLRDFPGEPIERLITHEFEDILNDDEIMVVAEVMGGIEPAYTYVKRLLEHGKSVVTSNKALVAAHGAELLAVAAAGRANFLFEASVGGGIPIIRALNTCLTADRITEITGILNGTTNYILSRMADCGKELMDALAEAQERGYAERDPAADIEGHDACRKLAILLSLVLKKTVSYEDIAVEGITGLSRTDMEYADKMNRSLKLLAMSRITDEGIFARVSPALIMKSDPLSTVNEAFNAVLVRGNMLGPAIFYGQGAGSLPTGSALASDIIDAVKHIGIPLGYGWSGERRELSHAGGEVLRKLVRARYTDKGAALAAMKEIYGSVEIIELAHVGDEFAFLTKSEAGRELDAKAERFKSGDGVLEIVNQIILY